MNSEGKIKISELKPHPKNDYYFDDMEGDSWDSLLQSISTSGVTNAITINDKKIIISGHQRIRACKVLGIEEVSYKMITYGNEENEIKDLIESNLRQRVLGNTNPVKLGRCFSFLNNWYGFHQGNGSNQHEQKEKVFTLANNEPHNQTELAESYGITKQTMNNYMRMADMIPELEDLVDTGIVTKDTALAMIRNLSSNEQRELITSMDITKKITKKEMKRYIDEIKLLKKENKELKDYTSSSATEKISNLKTENERLENENKILEAQKKISDDLANQYKSQSEEYMEVKKKLAHMGLEPDGDYNTFNATVQITELNTELSDFLENKLAPLKYKPYMFAIKSNDLLKRNFMNTLSLIYDWYSTMLSYIGEENEEENIIDIEMEEN